MRPPNPPPFTNSSAGPGLYDPTGGLYGRGDPGPSTAAMMAAGQSGISRSLAMSTSTSTRTSPAPHSPRGPSPSGADPGRRGSSQPTKANVTAACGPCKRAHLACDPARPCKRCVSMGKESQCVDVPVSRAIQEGTSLRLLSFAFLFPTRPLAQSSASKSPYSIKRQLPHEVKRC